MSRLVPVLVIGLAATGWVGAEETPAPAKSPEAIEILKKVDTAAKAVDSVRYKATSTPAGVAVNFVGAAEGTVVLNGWNGRTPEKFRIDAKTKPAGQDATVELSAGGNGETYFLIDRSTKKAYEDMDPAVLGRTGQGLQALVMAEFVHDKPFDDELNAENVQLAGKESVDGEECFKIDIVYSGQQSSTWFFSTKDYLPRRRIQKFTTPQGEGSIDRTISALEVAPKLDSSLFALALPEGFQKIDDFAP